MATSPSVSTQDLRSHAIEYKRDKDHNEKWALGESERATGGRRPIPDGLHRPVQPMSSKVRTGAHRGERKRKDKLSHLASTARRHDIDEEQSASDSSDPSELDAVMEPATAVPDAGITYSYDATAGPGRGSQILGMALAKAVEKFETRETDKLIKDEYEVVTEDAEEGKLSKKAGDADDEDFELL
ncbi:MAG: hypothetical protein M1838_005050 [Thelocarpon superellum]|nr:MAG: hypothetical protein M1838_005050 [Thelocarpon superellum]